MSSVSGRWSGGARSMRNCRVNCSCSILISKIPQYSLFSASLPGLGSLKWEGPMGKSQKHGTPNPGWGLAIPLSVGSGPSGTPSPQHPSLLCGRGSHASHGKPGSRWKLRGSVSSTGALVADPRGGSGKSPSGHVGPCPNRGREGKFGLQSPSREFFARTAQCLSFVRLRLIAATVMAAPRTVYTVHAAETLTLMARTWLCFPTGRSHWGC